MRSQLKGPTLKVHEGCGVAVAPLPQEVQLERTSFEGGGIKVQGLPKSKTAPATRFQVSSALISVIEASKCQV